MLSLLKKIIPGPILRSVRPSYHYALALLGAFIYRFPSREIKIVAITGTKGKSTTAELVNSVLEEAGYRTALVSTVRIKVGDRSEKNTTTMTTPGRLFLSRLLREAVNKKCDWAVLELSSEAVKQFRHKLLALDALIFTNIAPEHIEAHGSFEKYLEAKLSLAEAVATSPKRPRILIANIDNPHGEKFLAQGADARIGFKLTDAHPFKTSPEGSVFEFMGTEMATKLPGKFNLENIIAALHFGNLVGISLETLRRGIMRVDHIPGRAEFVRAGQAFDVLVDYAHTPDSLVAIYEAFDGRRKICVLGACGGGRDKWKRPEMGRVASEYCDEVILTEEDPFEEHPRDIIHAMQLGIHRTDGIHSIANRRDAIRKALSLAQPGDVVLITGKGTDPYIRRAHGNEPWSDHEVAKDEIERLLAS